MALHRSLVKHSPAFTLFALCLDDDSYAALEALDLAGVEPIRLAELEAADPELLAVKNSRTTTEYYFTCSPSLPLHVMRRHREVEMVTYLDADLFFYASPQPLFDELGTGSVLIVPHRFPEHLRHLEAYGVYNVGLLSFRNDKRAHAVLDRWHDQCVEWCYSRIEHGRFADQRYLDDWPSRPGVVILQHPGAGLGPWNFVRHRIDIETDPPTVDGRELIFYHFAGMKPILPGVWDTGLLHGSMKRAVKDRLYRRYIRELQWARAVLRSHGVTGPGSAWTVRRSPYTWRRIARRILSGQVMVAPERTRLLAARRHD